MDRGKNDAADAEAICEAMSRPKVQRRFVPVKTLEQQALQILMGVRNGLVNRWLILIGRQSPGTMRPR